MPGHRASEWIMWPAHDRLSVWPDMRSPAGAVARVTGAPAVLALILCAASTLSVRAGSFWDGDGVSSSHVAPASDDDDDGDVEEEDEACSASLGGWALPSGESPFGGSGACTIDRVTSMTSAKFKRQYARKKPFIISASADTWTDPALWTKSHLLSEYGHVPVKTGRSNRTFLAGDGYHKLTMSGVINAMAASGAAGKGEPDYIFDRTGFLATNGTKLLQSLKPPAYLRHNDPEHSDYYFLLGAAGTGVTLHAHNEAWNAVVYGRKRWFILPRTGMPALEFPVHHDQQSWVAEVLPRMGAEDRPMECVQEAGDIIYIPEGFMHSTINLGETVAVSAQASSPVGREHGLYEQAQSALRKRETIDDAFGPLKKLLKKEPHHQAALFLLGTAYAYIGSHGDAVHAFKELTQLAPSCTRAFIGLGFAHMNLQDYASAKESCDHATTLNPDDRQGWLCAANVADLNGDLEEAIDDLQKALSLRPDKKTFFLLARAYERLGEMVAAEDVKVEAEEFSRLTDERANTDVEGLVDFFLDEEVPPHLRP